MKKFAFFISLLFIQNYILNAQGNAQLVSNLNPVSSQSLFGQPTIVDNLLFFIAQDGVHGTELWRTDGTTAGTFMVKDIYPDQLAPAVFPRQLFAFGKLLLFIANNGTNGYELWVSNGTSAGTSMLKDINPDQDLFADFPQELTQIGNSVVFLANDGVIRN